MKKFFIFLLIFICLGCCVFLLTIKNLFNTNTIKNSINSAVAVKIAEYNKHYLFQKKEIKFSIRNSINLLVFPSAKIIINDFDLKNVQYRDLSINMNIKKIEINLDYLDLLRKKITPTKITLHGIGTILEINKLPDFYLTKEIKKRVVKLDNNEVFGVKDKLKNLLISSNSKILVEDGYKEIEVEEETKYELDNSKIKLMLLDLFKAIDIKEFNIKKVPIIEFYGANASVMDKGNIQKEFKNISGNLQIDKFKLDMSFILNNINGKLSLTKDITKEKNNAILKISNELNDNIIIDYNGDDFFVDDFVNLNSNLNVNIRTDNFNNLVQWILSVNSKYYNLFNYKKDFQMKTDIIKNGTNYSFENLSIDGKSIKLNGNANFTNAKNDINFNIENINFNDFVINSVKEKNLTKDEDITIFKIKNIDELFSYIVAHKNNNIKNTSVNLNIKKLSKNDKFIEDSVINFDILDGVYKINQLILNFDDIKTVISEPIYKDSLYYNKLTITGSDFSKITKLINLDKVINIKNFVLSSDIVINDNTLYLMNYELKQNVADNTDNVKKISGDIEYSFRQNYKYLAINSNIDNLIFNIKYRNTKTLKEKFLWLNNLTNISNIFIDLKVNNLTYNDHKNISLQTKVNYYSGVLNVYDIKNIDSQFFTGLKGKIYLDVKNNNPVLKANLFVNSLNYNLNIVQLFFDIEKYKHILTREDVDTKIQSKFWINRLFSLPTWEEIDGNMNLQIQNLKLNNANLNNVDINANIDNGLINLNRLLFVGLGGSTELKGKIDLKTTRNINLILTDTVYNLEDVYNLIVDKKSEELKGTIGIGGVFQANGFNSGVFGNSIGARFKFISNNFYIKKIGLENLKNNLKKIYSDVDLLKNLSAKDSILDNSGTTFDDVSGSLTISNGISDFVFDGKADFISNKFISKIDNSGSNIIINMVDTLVIMNTVGKNNIPLYGVITFKEDFANKANLLINMNQIDDYIKQVRKTKGL